MAFTESFPLRRLFRGEWEQRADQGPNPIILLNTDGCGLITSGLCDEINAMLAKVGYKVSKLLIHSDLLNAYLPLQICLCYY